MSYPLGVFFVFALPRSRFFAGSCQCVVLLFGARNSIATPAKQQTVVVDFSWGTTDLICDVVRMLLGVCLCSSRKLRESSSLWQ